MKKETKKTKKTKKTQNLASTLPHELIVEILLRLPVKSLLRFKCVCKSWLSLVSDPQFIESRFDLAHLRLLLPPNHHDSIQSLDVEVSLHHDSATLHLPLPPPSIPTFNSLVIMGSCRGLLLFNYEDCGDLIVWNPSIRVHKTILYPYYGYFYEHLYGFGYDASTDDYMVIIVELSDLDLGMSDWQTEMDIFSFKTNSWNHVLFPDVHYKDFGYDFRAGSLVNGALHWLVFGFSDDRKVPVIIALDLANRTLSEIVLPRHLTEEPKYELYSLRVLRGCLSLCCLNQDDATDDIWVMKEYKVQSSWTKSFVLSGFELPHNRFSPICITKDGGLIGSNVGGRIEKLSCAGVLLEHLTFSGAKWLYSGNPQLAMYRESSLSLPSNLGEATQDDQQ